jgi:hypothetical protein
MKEFGEPWIEELKKTGKYLNWESKKQQIPSD